MKKVCSCRWLLEHGCDPGVTDSRKRAPFDDCVDKESRNTFRRFMAQWPDKYDYKKVSVVCVHRAFHQGTLQEYEGHVSLKVIE